MLFKHGFFFEKGKESFPAQVTWMVVWLHDVFLVAHLSYFANILHICTSRFICEPFVKLIFISYIFRTYVAMVSVQFHISTTTWEPIIFGDLLMMTAWVYDLLVYRNYHTHTHAYTKCWKVFNRFHAIYSNMICRIERERGANTLWSNGNWLEHFRRIFAIWLLVAQNTPESVEAWNGRWININVIS